MFLFKVMQLLFKALEKRMFISSSITGGYESEGFHILHCGGRFTIRKGDKIVTLDKDSNPGQLKDFQKMLKLFLDTSFPK